MNKSLLFFILPCFAFAKIQIATTTSDLESVVRKVGCDDIEVFSIGKGTQDPHQIEAKPSYMIKLRNVDLVIAQGLELESAWLKPLVQGSRNPKINTPDGILELGDKLNPIEVARSEASRADGDVHPGGNPHFHLDPLRLGEAAVIIAQRLAISDPNHKTLFTTNAENFKKHLDEKTKDWQNRVKKTGVMEIVTYHKTFSYLCDRLNIQCKVQLEPKPGIPPTASHILSVIDQMKQRKIKIVLVENLYNDSSEEKLKQNLGSISVKKVPVSVNGESDVTDNEKLIERLVKAIEDGAK